MQLGTEDSAISAFSGDFSHMVAPVAYSIVGEDTLGRPETGYLYSPELTPYYTYFVNSSGWNESVTNNDGRTAATVFRVKLVQRGQGDAAAFSVSAFASNARSGATSWLANPAVTGWSGDFVAGANGVYLNPFEVILNDRGFDVTGIGSVVNLERSNSTGALGAYWGGVRVQSKGKAYIDDAYVASGPVKTGLNMYHAELGEQRAAIALKKGQRVYGNVKAAGANGFGITDFGGAYFSYEGDERGWQFSASSDPLLQLQPGKIVASKKIFADAGIVVGASVAPSRSNSECTPGDIAWDMKYIYLCASPNLWKRSSLQSW